MITYKQKTRFNVTDTHGRAVNNYRAERFDDVQSWIAAAREPVERFADESQDPSQGEEWDGGLDFEAAADLIQDGWTDGAAKVAHVAGVQAAEGNRDAVALTSAPFGFYGDAQAAMMGDADPYTAIDYVPDQKPVITVVAGISASSRVAAEQFTTRGAGILTAVQALERSGVRVELFAVGDAQDGGEKNTTVVRVKPADQPVNLPALAAVFSHPASFRRIGFAHIERLAGAGFCRGYGNASSKMPRETAAALFPDAQALVICEPMYTPHQMQDRFTVARSILQDIGGAEVLENSLIKELLKELST